MKKLFIVIILVGLCFVPIYANASGGASDYEFYYGFGSGQSCGIGINIGENRELTNFTCNPDKTGEEILQAIFEKGENGDKLTFEKDAKINFFGASSDTSTIVINGNNVINIVENQKYNIEGNGSLVIHSYQTYGHLKNENGEPLYEVFYINGLTSSGVTNSIHLKDADGEFLLVTGADDLSTIFESIKEYNPDLEGATFDEKNIEVLQPHYGIESHDISQEWIKNNVSTDLNVIYNSDGSVTFTSMGTILESDYVTFISKDVLNSDYTLSINNLFNNITDELKNSITPDNNVLLALYDISVINDDKEVIPMKDGSFTIKIKMNDEMKKYNELSAAYISDGKIAESFETSVDGDFVIFNTTHLSEYAIYGNNETVVDSNDNISNPSTGDNISFYLFTLCISVLGISSIVYKLKKNY